MSDGRTAGPVGRVLRLLMGTALTIRATQHMFSGNTALNLQAVGIVLGLLLLNTVVHLTISRFLPSINPWLGAVIAVDLDYSEFSGGGKSMLFLVASGTAVVAESLEPSTS